MSGAGRVVVGGVDTHKDVHVAAVIDGQGRILGTGSFPVSQKGYDLTWLRLVRTSVAVDLVQGPA